MSQTVSKVYSYLILLLNINFNDMLNFGYTHITVQHIFDIMKIEPQTGQDKNIEDEFSVL